MEKGTIPTIGLYASLFPARVNSDSITIHTTKSIESICHTPLEYVPNEQLHGLITLGSYVKGGNDGVLGVKLLVCVKSIGAIKKYSKNGNAVEQQLLNVMLFDHTGEVSLTVWQEMVDSVKLWHAGKTILLISNPGWVVNKYNSKGKIGFMKSTMIDVDPDFPDAEWLRNHALSLTKREALCLQFPEGIWDLDDCKYGITRILFTLAEIDEWFVFGVFETFIND